MKLTLKTVFDPEFRPYGQVAEGYETDGLVRALIEGTERPEGGTVYFPSVAQLEQLPAFEELSSRYYGGMPVQIGCCNGSNTRLNCLEYHRDSEVNIPADDVIFLVARQDEIREGKLDTSVVRAFSAPAGSVVELYATTLHYAPCNGSGKDGFRVAVVLPRGTNTECPAVTPKNWEDRLLWARNKWLIAHPDSSEAGKGAYVGLTGRNIDLAADL